MSTSTIVLVHGAWHGAWSWKPVVEQLEQAGAAVATVELPSSGDGPGADLGDVAADVAAIEAVLADLDGPVVLVGHSYGGIPITQVGDAGGKVAHLVYLTAFMLDAGESLAAALGEIPDWIEVVDDGAATVATRNDEIFYADVEDDVAAAASERLGKQSMASFTDEITTVGWKDIPSTYIVTDQDQAIPPPAQEQMSQRAGTVHHLDTSHSPFLSQPDAVTDLLTGIAADVG